MFSKLKLRRSLLFAVTCLCAALAGCAQTSVPEQKLSRPRIEVGGGDVELDRVRGAALLSGGRIAVADNGNSRVLIFSANGALEKSFGRTGSGPAEFQALQYLTAMNDTIVTWDAGLKRVTLWKPDGTVLRTAPLPSLEQPVVEVHAVKSTTVYLGTARDGIERSANGVFTDTFALIEIDASHNQPQVLGRMPWSYNYFIGQGDGWTIYPTPFLGETLVAVSAGRRLLLPLGSTSIEVTRADGVRGAAVTLPITIRKFDRSRVIAYRDSLIASMKEPDALSRDRLNMVFGTNFPVPELQAQAQRAVTVGNSVWFQSYPNAGDATTTWYVVDASREQLAGRFQLPRNSVVLGGNERSVLVLQRDADGVERVSLFDVPSLPR